MSFVGSVDTIESAIVFFPSFFFWQCKNGMNMKRMRLGRGGRSRGRRGGRGGERQVDAGGLVLGDGARAPGGDGGGAGERERVDLGKGDDVALLGRDQRRLLGFGDLEED